TAIDPITNVTSTRTVVCVLWQTRVIRAQSTLQLQLPTSPPCGAVQTFSVAARMANATVAAQLGVANLPGGSRTFAQCLTNTVNVTALLLQQDAITNVLAPLARTTGNAVDAAANLDVGTI